MEDTSIASSQSNDQKDKSVDLKASSSDERTEEKNDFASGLPAWDLLPPQVMVRRVRRTI